MITFEKMKVFLVFNIFVSLINLMNSVNGECLHIEGNCGEYDKYIDKELGQKHEVIDCCEAKFINAFKLHNKEYIIKFVSMNWKFDENSTQIDLHKVSDTFELTKTKFAVVVRVKKNSTRDKEDFVSVNVKDELKINITVNPNDDSGEERIPDKLYSDSDKFKISSNTFDYNLNDSYVVFCSRKTRTKENGEHFTTSGCKPEFKGEKVWCLCEYPKSQINSYLAFIVIVIFWSFMLLMMFWCKFMEPKASEPEVQLLLIMCSARTAKFQYEIVFRVGCPSDDFDMEKTTIDIELIGPQNQQIGHSMRFSANKLTDPVIADMKCYLGKLTPIPKIECIRAIHSGRSTSEIFFYDFIVKDIHTKEKPIIQEKAINDYIRNYSTTFKGVDKTEDQMTFYPEFPLPELSYFEIQLILFLITSIIATICMFISKCESLFNSLYSVAFSSIIALSIQTVFIYLYKYQIKKKDFEDKYDEGNQINKWTTIRYLLWCVMFFFIIVLTALLVYFGFQQTYIQTLFWLESCLCTASIVFGVWYIADVVQIDCFAQDKNIFKISKDDEQDLASIDSSISITASKTDNISAILSPDKPNPMLLPTVSSVSNIGNVSDFNIKKKDPK